MHVEKVVYLNTVAGSWFPDHIYQCAYIALIFTEVAFSEIFSYIGVGETLPFECKNFN